MNKKYIIYVMMPILLIVTTLISLLIGNYSNMTVIESLKTLIDILTNNINDNTFSSIMINIRLPRTFSAILIGAALATAGIAYQEVFDNELASPDILGVSTGACVGAAFGIVVGASILMIQVVSFIMGIITLLCVYIMFKLFKNKAETSLVIFGVLINGFMASLLGLIKFKANTETQLPSIVYWTMGDISTIDISKLPIMTTIILFCMLVLYLLRWKLNYFSVPETEAISMGINIKLLRAVVIIFATILVSCAVSFAGSIGWIGIVIPQFARIMVGKNTRYSLPLSIILGSIFLLLVDIIGRKISTAEIPLSILTGMIGIAIFIICMFFRRNKMK